MILRSYRAKVVAVAIFLSLLSQAILVITGNINFVWVSSEIRDNQSEKMFSSIHRNAMSLLNDVDILAGMMGTSDLGKYVQYYWNLRDPILADEARNKLNRQMNNLHISPSLVERIYAIGKNDNQRCFVKRMDRGQYPNEEVPSLDILQKAGIYNSLLKGDGMIVYFEKNELQQQVLQSRQKMKPEDFDKTLAFAQNLEGKLVHSRLYTEMTDFAIAIVISPDFVHDYFLKEKSAGEMVTLLDQDNRVVWSNLPEAEAVIKNAGKDLNSQLSGEWTTQLGGNRMRHQFMRLSPQEFKLVFSIPVHGFSKEEQDLVFLYGLMVVGACTLTFVAACIFSRYITQPLHQLAKMIHEQTRFYPFKKIPIEKHMRNRFSHLSFQNKTFLVLLLSVLIPLFLSGFGYNRLAYFYTRKKLQDFVISVSQQMSLNLSYQMKSYYLMNELISSDIFLKYLSKHRVLTEEEKVLIDSMLVAQPFNLTSFSYFVLLDNNGNALYQSVYPNNPELFSVPLSTIRKDYETKVDDIFWMPQIQDIFKQSTLGIVKRITRLDSNLRRETVGYFQMILKQNAFQSIKLDHSMEFVILDEDDKIVYQSIPMEEYVEAAVSLPPTGVWADPVSYIERIAGLQQIIVPVNIEGSQWRIFVFQRLDDALAKSVELLQRNIIIAIGICVLALLSAWLLSRILVKPVVYMGEKMKEVEGGNFNIYLKYENKDEISELIIAFNQMIEQIHKLVEENISRKLREQELITLKAQAELNMLQQQINPHFLYNTLELINMQVMQSGEYRASRMVKALARLFHYSMSNPGKTVPLEHEIEHIRNFIMIEEMRFQDKFSVEWDIDTQVMRCKVLKFILQPIVENAISHGLYEFTSGGIVSIAARRQDDMLILQVSDNGVGMDKITLERLLTSFESKPQDADLSSSDGVESPEKGGGIGLQNVYKRLSIYYQGQANMQIDSKHMRGTRVVIQIPYRMTIDSKANEYDEILT